jgi:hypothetical protein
MPDRFPFYDIDPSAVSVRDLDEDGLPMRRDCILLADKVVITPLGCGVENTGSLSSCSTYSDGNSPEAQGDIETPDEPICPRLARLLNTAVYVHEVYRIWQVHKLGCPVCGIKTTEAKKRAA